MPSTPTYGLPYPSLSDPPNGPAQFQALADEVEVELTRIDARVDNAEDVNAGFAAPTQTGSGTLPAGGTGATIMTVSISDPGFSYYVIASGSLGWGMVAGAAPGNLLEGSITLDSTTYNVNRLVAGFSVAHSLSAGFSQSTLIVPAKRSDAFGAFTGAHTVRLIARNSGASDMTITASGADTTLTVRIVRV
jgi:hypothetical protein